MRGRVHAWMNKAGRYEHLGSHLGLSTSPGLLLTRAAVSVVDCVAHTTAHGAVRLRKLLGFAHMSPSVWEVGIPNRGAYSHSGVHSAHYLQREPMRHPYCGQFSTLYLPLTAPRLAPRLAGKKNSDLALAHRLLPRIKQRPTRALARAAERGRECVTLRGRQPPSRGHMFCIS